MRLKFDACFKFSIVVEVIVQKTLKLELKLIGQVSFPLLKLVPDTISIKRISTDAIATQCLTASNLGSTVIRVQILLAEYPEFKASFSPHRKDPGIGKLNRTDTYTYILAGSSLSRFIFSR